MNENFDDIMVSIRLKDLINLENKASCYRTIADDYYRTMETLSKVRDELETLKTKYGEKNEES